MGSTAKKLGSWMLKATWAVAVVILFLPAYHGEVISPGSSLTLVSFQFILLALGTAFPNIAVILLFGGPLLLLALTPLCLLSRVLQSAELLGFFSGLLFLSALVPLAVLLIYDPSPNQLLFGAYFWPVPLVAAGLALSALSYGACVEHQGNGQRC